MATITWTDKTDATVSGLAESQKVTAATTAEIKTVVNANAATLVTAASDIQTLEGIAGATPLNYGFEISTAESSPIAGKFRFNNGNPALVTKIMINSTDAGFDQWQIFNILTVDSVISIQDRDGASRGGVFIIDAVTDNTTWFLLDVTVKDISLLPLAANNYAINFTIKSATGAGTGTVTSVSTTTNRGIVITGTPTINPKVDLVRIGTNNFIDVSTDLEGTAIASTDSIIYNDATDDTVKKGLVSDLPISLGTLSTGIGLNGASYDGTSSPAPWKVDYAGSSNNVIQAATDLESTDIATNDVIIYSDSSDTDIVKRGRVSDLPFSSKTASESFIMSASDATTDLTVGVIDDTFRTPYAFTLTGIRASLVTAATGAIFDVDVLENGTTILSTRVTLDSGEKTSTTAVTAPVISDSSLADDSEMSIEIKVIGSTIAGAGLKVTLIGYKT